MLDKLKSNIFMNFIAIIIVIFVLILWTFGMIMFIEGFSHTEYNSVEVKCYDYSGNEIKDQICYDKQIKCTNLGWLYPKCEVNDDD